MVSMLPAPAPQHPRLHLNSLLQQPDWGQYAGLETPGVCDFPLSTYNLTDMPAHFWTTSTSAIDCSGLLINLKHLCDCRHVGIVLQSCTQLYAWHLCALCTLTRTGQQLWHRSSACSGMYSSMLRTAHDQQATHASMTFVHTPYSRQARCSHGRRARCFMLSNSCYPGSIDASNNSISECIELDWSSALIYWPWKWKAERKKVLSWS